MLRSHSQILYSYLPGAVFRHEEHVYGKSGLCRRRPAYRP